MVTIRTVKAVGNAACMVVFYLFLPSIALVGIYAPRPLRPLYYAIAIATVVASFYIWIVAACIVEAEKHRPGDAQNRRRAVICGVCMVTSLPFCGAGLLGSLGSTIPILTSGPVILAAWGGWLALHTIGCVHGSRSGVL